MSKMNANATRNRVTSYEGNRQELKGAEQQFFELISMSFFGQDSFYETMSTKLSRLENLIDNLVKKESYDFICNAIIFARRDMYMRSFPVAAAVLFTKSLRTNNRSYENARGLICDVIQRADQINDVYAFALSVFGDKKKVPLSIKKGVADAFNKFDAYQFAKYNRKTQVKFSDVLRIVHPKAKDTSQGEIFAKIVDDSLETPYTWETELSKAGQVAAENGTSVEAAKKEAWKGLVNSGKLGYMALLRNLRNLEQSFSAQDEVIKKAASVLSDPEQVAKSKQFPFRFANALKNVSNNRFKVAISEAMEHSLGNLPSLGDNVVVMVDTSGSMTWGSGGGNFTPLETATLFGAAVAKAAAKTGSDVYLMACASTAKAVKYNPTDSITTIANRIARTDVGMGTNLHSGIELAQRNVKNPDAIIVLSDMQVNRFSGYGSYSNNYLKDAIKIAFNLNAYSSTPMSDLDGWFQMAGFSDKIFSFVDMQNNKDSIVKRLKGKYK